MKRPLMLLTITAFSLFLLDTSEIRAHATTSSSISLIYWVTSETDVETLDAFLDKLQAQLKQVDILLYRKEILRSDYAYNLPKLRDATVVVLITSGHYINGGVINSPLHEVSPFLEERGILFSLRHTDAAVDYATGVILFATNNCKSATSYLTSALEKTSADEDRAQILSYLAACSIVLGELEQAEQTYSLIIDTSPTIEDRFNLAWVYLQMGETELAVDVADYVLAHSRSEFYTYIHIKRSRLYALAFRFDEAIAEMDAAIESEILDGNIAEELAPLYTERGQRILLTYEWDEVLADYNRAIEIDPEYAPAYFHRGVLFYTQGPRENALPDFQTYLDLAPEGEFAEEAAEYMTEIEAELAAADD